MLMLIFLIFLVGLLLGAVAGAMLCVRYLRQEIAGNVGPRAAPDSGPARHSCGRD